jgi:hypothetical protein
VEVQDQERVAQRRQVGGVEVEQLAHGRQGSRFRAGAGGGGPRPAPKSSRAG